MLIFLEPVIAENAKDYKFPADHEKLQRRMPNRLKDEEGYTVVPKMHESPKQPASETPASETPAFKGREKQTQTKRMETPVQNDNADWETRLETPVIIHDKDKKLNESHQEEAQGQAEIVYETPANMKRDVERDIKSFMSQFDNSHDKQERAQIRKNIINLIIF
jgi:hypothetical protein